MDIKEKSERTTDNLRASLHAWIDAHLVGWEHTHCRLCGRGEAEGCAPGCALAAAIALRAALDAGVSLCDPLATEVAS